MFSLDDFVLVVLVLLVLLFLKFLGLMLFGLLELCF